MTERRLSEKMNFTKAPRVTEAIVRGSHKSVVPSATFTAMSPLCGGPSQWICSPLKSYFAILESAQYAMPCRRALGNSGFSATDTTQTPPEARDWTAAAAVVHSIAADWDFIYLGVQHLTWPGIGSIMPLSGHMHHLASACHRRPSPSCWSHKLLAFWLSSKLSVCHRRRCRPCCHLQTHAPGEVLMHVLPFAAPSSVLAFLQDELPADFLQCRNDCLLLSHYRYCSTAQSSCIIIVSLAGCRTLCSYMKCAPSLLSAWR